MYIQAVMDILNREFGGNLDPSYHTTYIREWAQWWEGRTNSFHMYREACADGRTLTRHIYSMRMAKKICEEWAAILLNEKTEIVVDDDPSNEFLQGIDGYGGVFGDIDFWGEANALVEKAFYSGTGAFLLKVDGLSVYEDGRIGSSANAKLRMEYLPAQCIIPLTERYGQITEAAFVSSAMVKGKSVIYLEIHTLQDGSYVIENRYYECSNNKLVRWPCPDGILERIITGSNIPLFSIVRPNIVNPYKGNMGLGCSVFAHAIDNLKGVDLAFNNFCRDFRLGGKKVFYNRALICDGLAPDDVMQQLFVAVGDELNNSAQMVHEFNPSLRVQDNVAGVQAQLDYLSFKCGFGTRHFRFDSTGSRNTTATEYTGLKQELKQNSAKHGIIINRAIRDIVKSILWAGRELLGQNVDPDANVTISFSDGYIISDEERKADDRQDLMNGVITPAEYRAKYYGETLEEAEAALNRQYNGALFEGAVE